MFVVFITNRPWQQLCHFQNYNAFPSNWIFKNWIYILFTTFNDHRDVGRKL